MAYNDAYNKARNPQNPQMAPNLQEPENSEPGNVRSFMGGLWEGVKGGTKSYEQWLSEKQINKNPQAYQQWLKEMGMQNKSPNWLQRQIM